MLGGDGQAVFKLQFAGAEIFKTDADQLAVFVHLEDDGAVFRLFRLQTFKGVVERVAEEGEDVAVFHEREAGAVYDIRKVDGKAVEQQAFFHQHRV